MADLQAVQAALRADAAVVPVKAVDGERGLVQQQPRGAQPNALVGDQQLRRRGQPQVHGAALFQRADGAVPAILAFPGALPRQRQLQRPAVQGAGRLDVEDVAGLRAVEGGIERAEAGLRPTVVARGQLHRQRSVQPAAHFGAAAGAGHLVRSDLQRLRVVVGHHFGFLQRVELELAGHAKLEPLQLRRVDRQPELVAARAEAAAQVGLVAGHVERGFARQQPFAGEAHLAAAGHRQAGVFALVHGEIERHAEHRGNLAAGAEVGVDAARGDLGQPRRIERRQLALEAERLLVLQAELAFGGQHAGADGRAQRAQRDGVGVHAGVGEQLERRAGQVQRHALPARLQAQHHRAGQAGAGQRTVQRGRVEPVHVQVETAAAVAQRAAAGDLGLAGQGDAQVADGLRHFAQFDMGAYRLHRQALLVERAGFEVADLDVAGDGKRRRRRHRGRCGCGGDGCGGCSGCRCGGRCRGRRRAIHRPQLGMHRQVGLRRGGAEQPRVDALAIDQQVRERHLAERRQVGASARMNSVAVGLQLGAQGFERAPGGGVDGKGLLLPARLQQRLGAEREWRARADLGIGGKFAIRCLEPVHADAMVLAVAVQRAGQVGEHHRLGGG
ncbi:hypothetical protein D9M69_404060 [compost metagenome]